jgi:serine/threonine-protein kinase RsbW
MTSTPLLDLRFTVADLSGLRRRVADCGRLAGLTEPRCSEFVLAVHELLCNAVQHGGGQGWVRLWQPGGTLRCRVSDHGPGLSGEVIPAAFPDPGASEAGRGLWLVRELSDRLHIGGDPGGAIVTLEFELTGERPEVAAASRGAWLDDAWGPFGK